MDWHGILETTFLICFWVGLVLTVVMAVLSGAFHTEFGAGSSFEGGHVGDLGGTDVEVGTFDSAHPHVGWTDSAFPGASPLSPTVLCTAVTGLGGIGYLALVRWDLGPGGALATGLLASLALGAASFFALDFMLRRLQSTSHVSEQALVGTLARVLSPIESQQAGGIVLEAKGTRMTMPARAADASRIPIGAVVEIKRVDGGVYVVEETRESWLARSRAQAGRPDPV
jgi:membrane protein implicated in regulation of membrane protease activity